MNLNDMKQYPIERDIFCNLFKDTTRGNRKTKGKQPSNARRIM